MENEFCFRKERGKKFWIKRAIFIPFAIAGGILVFGFAVMYLWNALVPAVFGLGIITFWQAIGIFILSKILFGGFHGGHGGNRFHRHGKDIRERWMHLSPEEKEKMRREWWGRPEPPKEEE
jgi:hypothetical protein